jgi:hypothetical protein
MRCSSSKRNYCNPHETSRRLYGMTRSTTDQWRHELVGLLSQWRPQVTIFLFAVSSVSAFFSFFLNLSSVASRQSLECVRRNHMQRGKIRCFAVKTAETTDLTERWNKCHMMMSLNKILDLRLFVRLSRGIVQEIVPIYMFHMRRFEFSIIFYFIK